MRQSLNQTAICMIVQGGADEKDAEEAEELAGRLVHIFKVSSTGFGAADRVSHSL